VRTGRGARSEDEDGGAVPQNVPWEDAINRVLADADRSLHYTEIADRIVSEGLRRSVGATPATTVAAYLSSSLKETTSPYLRVGRGEYTLKEKAVSASNDQVKTTLPENVDQETDTGALRAFGMFWHRDLVFWTGAPRLSGRQGASD
jgi:HB1, ASXL, restriction endonuclease HTH domain